MKVIRRGVFETNSSSTHTLTILNEEQYEDYKNGKYYAYCGQMFPEDKLKPIFDIINGKRDFDNIDLNLLAKRYEEAEVGATVSGYTDDIVLEVRKVNQTVSWEQFLQSEILIGVVPAKDYWELESEINTIDLKDWGGPPKKLYIICLHGTIM